MQVRAKFYVQSLKQSKMYSGKIGTTVELSPVMSGSEENKKFYDASPSGKIELGIMNPEAAAAFEIGKEYYIDFTSAES